MNAVNHSPAVRYILTLLRWPFTMFREGNGGENLPLILFWAICLFLMTNPFTFWLMGEDPTARVVRNIATMRRPDGSQLAFYMIRAVVPIAGFVLVGVLGRMRETMRAIGALWPVYPFLLWATLSVLWSDSPGSTIHGVGALIPIFLTAGLMVGSLGSSQAAKATLYGGILIALASTAYALLVPSYGVHQHADTAQSVHAGLWRGVYMHKNFLGQTAALFAAATFLCANRNIWTTPVRLLVLGLWIVLIAKAGSASSMVIFPLTVGLVFVMVTLGPMQKAFALFAMPLVAIIGFISFSMVLQALGRDMTFSGRTIIWDLAVQELGSRFVQGYGFMSPTYGNFVFELSRRAFVRDPHNMYLDVILALGVIGLILLLIAIVVALNAAAALYARGGRGRPEAMVFASLLLGWMLSGLSESNDRPLGVVTTVGFFAIGALLASRPALKPTTLALPGPRQMIQPASIF